jgi:hypothetical protein
MNRWQKVAENTREAEKQVLCGTVILDTFYNGQQGETLA